MLREFFKTLAIFALAMAIVFLLAAVVAGIIGAAQAQAQTRVVVPSHTMPYAGGQRALGVAVTVEGSNACVCQLTPFMGLCHMPYGDPGLPPPQFIYGKTCLAPAAARVVRSTYLSDELGNVKAIIMEWRQ